MFTVFLQQRWAADGSSIVVLVSVVAVVSVVSVVSVVWPLIWRKG